MNVGFALQPSGYFYALPTTLGMEVFFFIIKHKGNDFFVGKDELEIPPLWLPFALEAALKLARTQPAGRC